MQNEVVNITVDGDAGSGKSTMGKILSELLGFGFLSTGSLYRAMALDCLKNNVDLFNKEKIIDNLSNITLNIKYVNNIPIVVLNNTEIDEKLLHTEEVSKATAYVAKYQPVRDNVKQVQLNLAENNNIVMEGRDIGTVVLPNAQYKFFLTALPEIRAERRYKQLILKGEEANYDEVLANIICRDMEDKHRELSPSLPATDATIIDTSNFDMETAKKYLVETAINIKNEISSSNNICFTK